MAEASKASAQDFVKQQVYHVALKTELLLTLLFRMLPLYHGPTIKIRIKTGNTEITVSRDLLCAESSVFTKMFKNGHFKESQEQALDLEEMDDVISTRALEALFQWLYRGIIRFNIESPEEHVSAAMELVRFADMYEIDRLEGEMAKYVKEIIVSADTPFDYYGDDQNTYFLKSDHIISASNLPCGHAVRRLLAAASVEGYLRSDEYKFAGLTQEYASFGADLLQEVQLGLRGLRRSDVSLEDPIRGGRIYINAR
ncbi:hypothetical protein N7533_008339 [Penicillium manginii]|uniref:uncharacterized protein n=1 Tax=Penicillium manginii TaxID=203109 RepID=UPI002549036A|nr:uncharacterized protein N7533_008339 [Penicillium manginii]KAJ5751311.1 hypothetical protein N7533_008339 [Penicillium manginii]